MVKDRELVANYHQVGCAELVESVTGEPVGWGGFVVSVRYN